MSVPSGLSADPYQLIAGFLAAGPPAEPEPVFLAWLLSLDAGLDPAEAATALLTGLPGAAAGPLVPQSARLMAMLEDTTRWPRSALDALATARRKPVARS
jgi:hypothetical protein